MKYYILYALVNLLILIPASSSRAAEAEARLIARVHGEEIYLKDLEPPANMLASIARQATPEQQEAWKGAYRLNKLNGLILRPLAENYIKQHKLGPTKEEAEQFSKAFMEHRIRLGQESDEGLDDDFIEAWLKTWKLNRDLYQKYKGRVVMRHTGIEPVDAYRAYLKSESVSKTFNIIDPRMNDAFWKYYTSDTMHKWYEGDIQRYLDEPLPLHTSTD